MVTVGRFNDIETYKHKDLMICVQGKVHRFKYRGAWGNVREPNACIQVYLSIIYLSLGGLWCFVVVVVTDRRERNDHLRGGLLHLAAGRPAGGLGLELREHGQVGPEAAERRCVRIHVPPGRSWPERELGTSALLPNHLLSRKRHS
jgi:hypothetical protein